MAEWVDESQVIVRIATLDEAPNAEQFEHIWVSHDLEWLIYDDSLKHFPEGPKEPLNNSIL